MKTKHTPGPWRWEFNGNAGHEYLASRSIEDGTFQWVDTKEDKLVQAAAPELLDALKERLSVEAEELALDKKYRYPDTGVIREDLKDEWLAAYSKVILRSVDSKKRAEAAMAKATGTQL